MVLEGSLTTMSFCVNRGEDNTKCMVIFTSRQSKTRQFWVLEAHWFNSFLHSLPHHLAPTMATLLDFSLFWEYYNPTPSPMDSLSSQHPDKTLLTSFPLPTLFRFEKETSASENARPRRRMDCEILHRLKRKLKYDNIC